MADTTTASLGFDTVAYNLLMGFALRPQLFFDDLATVRTTPQTHKGVTVQFPFMTEMAVASTPLTEGTDINPPALADTSISVTMQEYGNGINYTSKVNATSYIPLDPAYANLIGYNAGVSIDTVALGVLAAGTNVAYGGTATSRTTIVAGSVIDSADIRLAYARLTAASVMPGAGGAYRAYLHPDVLYDLKSETGEVGWRAVHNYSLPQNIQNGSPGFYEGFVFRDSPRTLLRVNASNGAGATGTIDVYDTYFMGADGIAKIYARGTHFDGQAYGPQPMIVAGPVVDSLWREKPLGWYWLGGYGIYRQEGIRRLETSSSIGANAA